MNGRFETVRRMPELNVLTQEGWEDAELIVDTVTGDYYVMSTVTGMFNETLIFPCDAEGGNVNWIEVAGARHQPNATTADILRCKWQALAELRQYVESRHTYDLVIRVRADEFPSQDTLASLLRRDDTKPELFAARRNDGQEYPTWLQPSWVTEQM